MAKNCVVKGKRFSCFSSFPIDYFQYRSIPTNTLSPLKHTHVLSYIYCFVKMLYSWSEIVVCLPLRVTIEHARSRRGRGGGPSMGRFGGGGGGGYRPSRSTGSRYVDFHLHGAFSTDWLVWFCLFCHSAVVFEGIKCFCFHFKRTDMALLYGLTTDLLWRIFPHGSAGR